MGTPKKWLKKIVSRRGHSHAERDNNNVASTEKHSRWNFWKSSAPIDKRTRENDGEPRGNGTFFTSSSMEAPGNFVNRAALEKQAAICIQTAFRGFLARRALRALKGLVRLQASISGQGVRKQSAGSLRCIQAYVRIQARIRTHRVLKSRKVEGAPKNLTGLTTNEPLSAEAEPGWDDSIGTIAETQAKVQQRHEAAIKRERAMAYAFSNQWRANTKMGSETLFDYDLDNSTWSWIWLDRWMSGNQPPVENRSMNSSGNQHEDLQTIPSEESAGKIIGTASGASMQKFQNFKASPKQNHKPLEGARSQGTTGSPDVLDVNKKGPKNERRASSSPQQRLVKDINRRHSLPNPVKRPSSTNGILEYGKSKQNGPKEHQQSSN